jgi:hypothetical protein
MVSNGPSPWDLVPWLLPLVSGVAFYGLMEWHPWSAAPCDEPVWTVVTWIPFLALPPIAAGVRLRRAQYGWAGILAVMVGSLVVTAMACFVAFAVSLGHLHCGD